MCAQKHTWPALRSHSPPSKRHPHASFRIAHSSDECVILTSRPYPHRTRSPFPLLTPSAAPSGDPDRAPRIPSSASATTPTAPGEGAGRSPSARTTHAPALSPPAGMRACRKERQISRRLFADARVVLIGSPARVRKRIVHFTGQQPSARAARAGKK